MDTIRIFLEHLWQALLGATIVWLIILLRDRVTSPGRDLFLRPGSFRELDGIESDEQHRLLERASIESPRSWRSSIPEGIFFLFVGLGIAIRNTLREGNVLPDNIWATTAIVGLFLLAGGWLAGRLAARLARPYLERLMTTDHVHVEEIRQRGSP